MSLLNKYSVPWGPFFISLKKSINYYKLKTKCKLLVTRYEVSETCYNIRVYNMILYTDNQTFDDTVPWSDIADYLDLVK